ncbi:hypothetical protein CYMTET_43609 [Cymbomonas tetramitiformis]|uniref:Uncharacterized protein n=1 Tax=Cymbomonas tetramitiformis TaxID=36881 RepID=A0AAE0C2X2_9CHLO|nr:hypothetical protein CYMTET_43609 [Cymbomonas tetramitiformis]
MRSAEHSVYDWKAVVERQAYIGSGQQLGAVNALRRLGRFTPERGPLLLPQHPQRDQGTQTDVVAARASDFQDVLKSLLPLGKGTGARYQMKAAEWKSTEAVPKKNVAGVGTTTAMLQTALLTLYAIFFKFEKMNKAIAVTFVAILKTIIKTIIEMPAHVKAILASSVCRCSGAREENKYKLRNHFGGSQGAPLLAELNGLGSLIKANMQRVAYCLIAVLWLTIAWTLFTYAMLLREMMSIEAQNEFFAMWATAFGVGLFGVETMQIILIQIFASIIGDKIHMMFADIDPSMLWFEKFIQSKMSMEDAALDDNRQNDDDAGDQDMGDDADAFG